MGTRERRVLVLMTSSYPFGDGEPFLATEFPYLHAAFDHVVILCNDVASQTRRELPPDVEVLRVPYELTWTQKLSSTQSIFHPELLGELDFLRARVPEVPVRSAVATVLVTWGKARRVARLLRSVAQRFPDSAIHAYSYWANDMAVAAAYARAHGWVDRAWARAHGWDVYFHRSEVGFLPFRRYLHRHLDRLLFVSRNGLEYFTDRTGLQGGPLVHLPLGTPPASSGAVGRQRPFVVLSCSSLIPLKRVDLIPKALAELGHPARWLHIGHGPDRPQVDAACQGLPPDVQVDLLGGLSHPEVMAIYDAERPSVFVNVSSTEGLPVSIMEAMSAGVPVVATDVGGVSEIVRPEHNGLLLPPDPTPRHIAVALNQIWALSPEAYRSLSEGARSTWQTDYAAERNFRALLEQVVETPLRRARGIGP